MIIYFYAILALEIKFITLGHKDKKFFEIFSGLFFGFFISIFLYYLYSCTDIFSYDTGSWVTLGALFNSVLLSILNSIIGVIGLILQKKKQNEQLLDNRSKVVAIISFFVVSLISFMVIFAQYTIKKNDRIEVENEIKKETLIYLKNKYGSSEFKVFRIDRDFAENGFIGTDHLENYDIYAVYIPDNIEFYIYLDVDDSRNILKNSFDDDFISTKYSEKYFKDDDFTNDSNKSIKDLNIYLKQMGFNVNVDLYSRYVIGLDNDKAVPSDYGRIPSRDKLYNLILDYHIKHDSKIIINKYELKSNNLKSEMKTYLINLSNSLINYYNNLDDYKIKFYYNDENGNIFSGELIINNEYISIYEPSIKEEIKR